MPYGYNPNSWRPLLSIWVCSLLLVGCASTADRDDKDVDLDAPGPYENRDSAEPTVVSYDDYNDPFEKINRPIFKFNHVTYRYLLTPLAKGYQKVMPKPVDNSLKNVFNNLREPLYFLNNLLQLKAAESGKSVLRLGINSTLGLLGLFDPADAWWGIEREDTDFSDTLARYKVGYGAYLVIPIIGPSDIRDGASMTFDYFTHPLRHFADEGDATVLLAVDGFIEQVPTLSSYVDVVEESEDPYLFVRNLYLQGIQRDAVELRKRAGLDASHVGQ